jgi:hypothetical protein
LGVKLAGELLCTTQLGPNVAQLNARRHSLNFITQATPVVRLQLGVFDTLLAPVLVQPADMVLALLEMDKFIANAFLDEDAPRMLLHNGFFVLRDMES